MKKLAATIVIVAIAISLVGCGSNAYVSGTAKEYGYFCFPNTDWGMSEVDFYSVMNKSETNYTVTEVSGTDSADTIKAKELSEKTKFLGRTAIIKYMFSTLPYSDEFVLDSVRLTFEKTTHDDYDKLCKEVNTSAKKQCDRLSSAIVEKKKIIVDPTSKEKIEVMQNDTRYKDVESIGITEKFYIESLALQSDLPQKLKDDYNGYYRYINAEKGFPDLPNGVRFENIDLTQTTKQQLSSVAVYYEQNNLGEESCDILFNGTGMATVIACSKALPKK